MWRIPIKLQKKNSSSYSATIADSKITVNGVAVDNTKEEYPLLVFRDVTYFPTTWRFAADAFGWTYEFDGAKGLALGTSNTGLHARAVSLPIAGGSGAFVMVNGYFYYQGGQNKIFRAPVSDSAKAEVIYQLAGGDDPTVNTLCSLKEESGRVILTYHTGGAVMGSDHKVWLKEDGTYQEMNYYGYDYTKDFGEFVGVIDYGVPPYDGNLYIDTAKTYQTEDLKSVGDPNYLYGWTWTVNQEGGSRAPIVTAYIIPKTIFT